tara:strand:+ start:2318 stop:3985 length:1668 start_codon:yes stop_codon:yes gene_type:complete
MISKKLKQAIDEEKQKLKASKTFIYECHLAETDELVAYKVRFEYRNLSDKPGQKNDKTFRFFSIDGKPKLPVGMNASQFHFYGWNRIGDAKKVLVVEGEEVVKTLLSKNIPSVSPMTTGQPCEEAFSVLKDRQRVAVWPDNDPPDIRSGEVRFLKAVDGLLRSGQENVVRINWENAPPFGDAVDAINQDIDIIQLLNDAVPIKAIPPKNLNGSRSDGSTLQITKLSEVKSKDVQWVWEKRIPLGKNTMITGDPNAGKSYLVLGIASHVSTGRRWPDGAGCDVGNIMLVTAEDGLEDTVAPRLTSLAANLDRIIHLSMEVASGPKKDSLVLGKDLPDIEKALVANDIRLLIIDPITAVVGDRNSFKGTDVRQMMTPVTEMCERTNTALLTVMHQNKNSREFNAMYRVSGSGDFVAVARSVYLVARHPENEDLRIFSAVKSNLSSQAHPLAFSISQVDGFQWSKEPVSLTAQDILLASQNIETTSQLEESVEFLVEILKDGNSVPATEIFKEAEEIGIANATLRRAKTKLKIKSRRVNVAQDGKSRWVWELPKDLTL